MKFGSSVCDVVLSLFFTAFDELLLAATASAAEEDSDAIIDIIEDARKREFNIPQL